MNKINSIYKFKIRSNLKAVLLRTHGHIKAKRMT